MGRSEHYSVARLVLFPWDICFVLCLGLRKQQPQLGMHFWEGMGSSFTSPTCPPQPLVSEGSGGGFPVLMSVEIPLAVPSALLLLLFPMAEPWLSTDRAKAPPCKHKARDQGCNNRLHLLLWQCVPHMCEIRALSCLSDPLSKGCARWSQQIFWWCYMWLGISSVQWQLGRDES